MNIIEITEGNGACWMSIRRTIMALSNLSGWVEDKTASGCGAACGAGDKPNEKPAACCADDKPAEAPAACGAGDKPQEKPSACGSSCGAGDK